MSNIFIVESPFQLSNAIKMQSENDYLIVRMNGEHRNDKQIDVLLKDFKGKIYKKTIKSERKIELITNSILGFIPIILFNYEKHLIIGNYDSLWMKSLAYFLKPFNFYVLDDGLITIRMVQKLEDRISGSLFIKKWLFKLCSPTFITKYKIDAKNINILRLKDDDKKVKKKIRKGSVCFIGSPLVEKNVVSKEYFIKTLNEIFEDFKVRDSIIEYYPHRAEKTTNDIDCFLDGIISSDLSIESYYDLSEELPEYFISFYSSALINLNDKYPDCKFISYMLDDSEINKDYMDVIQDAYNFLKYLDFKVIEL
ncbi:TPA: hypothetical protein ACX6QN_003727 [Photobacterium damselae]